MEVIFAQHLVIATSANHSLVGALLDTMAILAEQLVGYACYLGSSDMRKSKDV